MTRLFQFLSSLARLVRRSRSVAVPLLCLLNSWLIICGTILVAVPCVAADPHLEPAAKPSGSLKTLPPLRYKTNPIKPGPGHSVVVLYEEPAWARYVPWIEQALYHSFIDIGSVVQFKPGLSFEIALIHQQHFKRSVTGTAWVTAAYHRGRIYIPIDDKKALAARKLRYTIAHEYMHAIIDDVTSGRAPGWLDEGLALLAEGSMQETATRSFYDWILDHELIPLASLSQGYTTLSKSQATYAYIQSRKAVEYLLENYGQKKLGFLLAEIGNDVPVPDAFLRVYNLTMPTFEANLELELRAVAKNRKLKL